MGFVFALNNKAEEVYSQDLRHVSHCIHIFGVCYMPDSVLSAMQNIKDIGHGPTPQRVYNLRNICILYVENR